MGRIINWIRRLLGLDKPIPIPPGPDLADVEEIKGKLFELHNQQRVSKGLTEYMRTVELDRSAQLHNDYMAQHNNLTHNEPGRDIGVRMKEQGYNWSWAGENIAMGQRTAEEVMNSWMNSSGHRSNILSSNFKEIGFGVTKMGNVWWWTVNFGKRN